MTSTYVTVSPALPSALHPSYPRCRPSTPTFSSWAQASLRAHPKDRGSTRGRGCSLTPCLQVSTQGTKEATGPSPLQPGLLGQETAASRVTPLAGSSALRELSVLLAPLDFPPECLAGFR